MKYDNFTMNKLRELSILEVAEKLDFELIGVGDEGRRALCPYHDDNHPSLHFSKAKGIFKCFACGAKGDLFKLVMDERNCTFVEACDWLVKEFNIFVIPSGGKESRKNGKTETRKNGATETRKQESVNPEIRKSVIPLDATVVEKKTSAFCPLPSDIISKSLSVDSLFCKSVVSAGYLSEGQLRHAAARYRLGCTKDGGVIFWEIDNQQQVHTGKIMYYQPDCHRDKEHHPTWVHSLMKDKLPENYELQHCLFGQHLLTSALSHQPSAVCIVESEKTAFILSEILPDFLWLSCGGLHMFKAELLAPLVDYKVVIFPDTDETGEAFKQWLTVLRQAQQQYPFKYPLRISRLLEYHASPEQKQRKIDIVDFIFDP